jgi:hypothetical protein
MELNLNNFGEKLKINYKKNNDINEKQKFLILVNNVKYLLLREEKQSLEFGLDLFNYDEPFFQTIDALIYEKYGPNKSDIIFWYLYENFGKENNTILILNEKNEEEEIEIKNINQLWKLINKMK